MKLDLTVTYDDGRQETVTAGQREMAAWEAEPFGCASTTAMDVKPMMFLRYIAWAALRRTGSGIPPYAKWQTAVDEVDGQEDDDQSATAPDPTDPDQPAAD